MIATSLSQSCSISSVSCMRKVFLGGSLGRPCRKARNVLRRSASDMFAGTAEEDGYRKFCEHFEHFEKPGIIEDSTD